MKKKIVFATLALLTASWYVWAKVYTFNVDKATAHLTVHGRKTSKSWCAWYTMRALQAGGCPAILLPAQWYSWFMPEVGFSKVSSGIGNASDNNYKPQAGDVVVFQRPKEWGGHLWGHIAMYNGNQQMQAHSALALRRRYYYSHTMTLLKSKPIS